MDTSETLAFITDRIKGLCEESGISVNELAKRSGLAPSTLYAIFKGTSANPCVDTLRKLCAALSISLKDLFPIDKNSG